MSRPLVNQETSFAKRMSKVDFISTVKDLLREIPDKNLFNYRVFNCQIVLRISLGLTLSYYYSFDSSGAYYLRIRLYAINCNKISYTLYLNKRLCFLV